MVGDSNQLRVKGEVSVTACGGLHGLWPPFVCSLRCAWAWSSLRLSMILPPCLCLTFCILCLVCSFPSYLHSLVPYLIQVCAKCHLTKSFSHLPVLNSTAPESLLVLFSFTALITTWPYLFVYCLFPSTSMQGLWERGLCLVHCCISCAENIAWPTVEGIRRAHFLRRSF